MNPQIKAAAILMCAALGAAPLQAAIESVKIEPTFVPRLCPVMEMEGVTEARLTLAVAIDETGKLTETLVLATSHPAFVRPALEAIHLWKFQPARRDGEPVAVQTELTIDYSAQGVVVSRNSLLDVANYMDRKFGVRMERRAHTAAELDRKPVPVKAVTPRYAADAAAAGVKGAVQVSFYIDETGAVRMPAVGVGSDPYLAQAAVEAVREWKFEPARHRGEPVLVAARQVFKFGS